MVVSSLESIPYISQHMAFRHILRHLSTTISKTVHPQEMYAVAQYRSHTLCVYTRYSTPTCCVCMNGFSQKKRDPPLAPSQSRMRVNIAFIFAGVYKYLNRIFDKISPAEIIAPLSVHVWRDGDTTPPQSQVPNVHLTKEIGSRRLISYITSRLFLPFVFHD